MFSNPRHLYLRFLKLGQVSDDVIASCTRAEPEKLTQLLRLRQQQKVAFCTGGGQEKETFPFNGVFTIVRCFFFILMRAKFTSLGSGSRRRSFSEFGGRMRNEKSPGGRSPPALIKYKNITLKVLRSCQVTARD